MGLSLFALAAVVAAVTLWPRGPKPALATFNQVQKGMTLKDVNATVGKSPDHTLKHYVWVADDATLEVSFGYDGRAHHVLVEPKPLPTVPPAPVPSSNALPE